MMIGSSYAVEPTIVKDLNPFALIRISAERLAHVLKANEAHPQMQVGMQFGDYNYETKDYWFKVPMVNDLGDGHGDCWMDVNRTVVMHADEIHQVYTNGAAKIVKSRETGSNPQWWYQFDCTSDLASLPRVIIDVQFCDIRITGPHISGTNAEHEF